MQTQQSFSIPSSLSVTDGLLWPSAFASNDADLWRQDTLEPNEREQLDDLLSLALTNPDVHHRLLVQHDPSLLDSFALSEETKRRFCGVQINTLKEFAQAILETSVSARMRVSMPRR